MRSFTGSWYDKTGQPLVTHDHDTDLQEWLADMQLVERMLQDKEYKVVAQEYTPKKKYWVSTVWLGYDHNFGGGKPIIFETMVFSGRLDRWYKLGGKRHYTRSDYAQVRYHTEAQAKRGHKKLLKEYTKKEKK